MSQIVLALYSSRTSGKNFTLKKLAKLITITDNQLYTNKTVHHHVLPSTKPFSIRVLCVDKIFVAIWSLTS